MNTVGNASHSNAVVEAKLALTKLASVACVPP